MFRTDNNDPTQFQRLETTNETEIQAGEIPEIEDQAGRGSMSTTREDFKLEGLQNLAGAHDQ